MQQEAIAEPARAKSTASSGRRLSDKILIAFHQACDQADFDVAEHLASILETMAKRPPHEYDGRRRDRETLVAAYERLWYLRHPTSEGTWQ